MKQLIRNVEQEIKEEFDRANRIHPPFRSKHEGIAIIAEEVLETSVNFHDVEEYMVSLQTAVFADADDDELEAFRDELEKTALLLACEAIQVAAMAQKFRPLVEPDAEIIVAVHANKNKKYQWHNLRNLKIKVGDVVTVGTSRGAEYARVVEKKIVPLSEAERHKEVLNVW